MKNTVKNTVDFICKDVIKVHVHNTEFKHFIKVLIDKSIDKMDIPYKYRNEVRRTLYSELKNRMKVPMFNLHVMFQKQMIKTIIEKYHKFIFEVIRTENSFSIKNVGKVLLYYRKIASGVNVFTGKIIKPHVKKVLRFKTYATFKHHLYENGIPIPHDIYKAKMGADYNEV